MLLTISIVVELVALLMAIWLGIYLVTRSVRKAEAWLAALTAWSLGGLFINNLFSLVPPSMPSQLHPWLNLGLLFWPRGILEQDPAAWLQGWTATPASVFWFHATMVMRPGKMNAGRRLAVAGAYLVAAGGVAIQVLLPETYKTVSGDPLFLNSLHGSWLYGLYLSVMLLFCALSVRNLLLLARDEPRDHPQRKLRLLIAVTTIAGLSGPVGMAAAFLNIPVPMFSIALLVAAGLLLTSYDVARYNALMEHRVFLKDFSFSAFSVGSAILLCLAVVWTFDRAYELPPFLYITTSGLAVVLFSLVDAARQKFDFRHFQKENRLQRERLRSLAHPSGENEILNNLSRALVSICAPLQACYAILLKREAGEYKPIAGYRWEQPPVNLPLRCGDVDDLSVLKPGALPAPLENAAVLLPVYFSDRQVGALVLGEAEHGSAYSPIDLENLMDCNDYLAGRLEHLILFEQSQELLNDTLLAAAALPSELSPSISTAIVELGLRRIHDYAQLSELPLANLNLVRQRLTSKPTHLEVGEAVHTLLSEALEKLHPGDRAEPVRVGGVPRRDWYPHIILREAYLNGTSNREIMAQLYISEGTFNRTRRSAIRSIARLLQEMEAAAAPAHPLPGA